MAAGKITIVSSLLFVEIFILCVHVDVNTRDHYVMYNNERGGNIHIIN